MRISSAILIVVNLILAPVLANEEPLADKLREHFKKPYLSVGALVQIVGDFQAERSFEGTNGFNISSMRINLSGELDKGFGYFLNTNFLGSRSILDAVMSLKFSENASLRGGLFRTPFSKELLTGIASIDMVNRSQVVSILAPARQIGLELSLSQQAVTFTGGVFNGNGMSNRNDNNDFMVMGRLAFTPQIDNGEVEIGVNAATSNDDNADIAGLRFEGKRTLFGADLRFTSAKILVAGEYIYSKFDPRGPFGEFNPNGFHATAGYMVNPTNQILVRLDRFAIDNDGPDSTLLIFGYNLWPTSMTELQVNYIVDTDDSSAEHHQLLINTQVVF